jgi:hypothetical protein
LKLSDKTKAIVGYEYDRAVRKHGPTFDSIHEGMDVLVEEFNEAFIAYVKGDIYGRHGVRREVAQITAVCIKILEGLPEVEA